jgi:hypothetical protein
MDRVRLASEGMSCGEVGAGCSEDEGDADAAEADVGDVWCAVRYAVGLMAGYYRALLSRFDRTLGE